MSGSDVRSIPQCEYGYMDLQEAASRSSECGLHAKLCFAHAETIIPLACLLGLFGPNSNRSSLEEQQCSTTAEPHHWQSPGNTQQTPAASCNVEASTSDSGGSCTDSDDRSSRGSSEDEQRSCDSRSWEAPLARPPIPRNWRGSLIAPYGANIQFMLHGREDSDVSVSTRQLHVDYRFTGIMHC